MQPNSRQQINKIENERRTRQCVFFCVQYFLEAEALPKKNKGLVQ